MLKLEYVQGSPESDAAERVLPLIRGPIVTEVVGSAGLGFLVVGPCSLLGKNLALRKFQVCLGPETTHIGAASMPQAGKWPPKQCIF